jgi:hypothetical protein
LLIEKDIGVEAGLFDAAAAETFVTSGLARRCLRILLEPRGADAAAAIRSADDMIAVLDRAGITGTTIPRLLHGSNVTAWGVLDEAAKRGYDTRAGLEDTLVMPDGTPAPDNASILVEALRRVEHSPRRV